eukprot:Phypoly_transcript_03878.p1 GENE.Phypoly_transcript_03878~~Phypoly_transcript_03878.p1  ORF type:complete len:714 (+),score=62.63 Phypoly_transcript_03878:256-2142(+)
MAQDRYFVDRVKNVYTVDKYLDDLNTRYGGIDSVLVWPTYPNMGIDNRNQFDLVRDMLGGIEGVQSVVQAFNEKGVHVLFPYNPWDQGTRDSGQPDYISLAALWKETGIEGFNGDTMPYIPYEFFDQFDRPIALEPEGGGIDSDLWFTKMGWGYWSYNFIPTIDRFKWLEQRHMTNICNRWAQDHTNDMQHAFFNGCGFESWESIWGIWNQLNLRDAEATRRFANIESNFKPFLLSPQWEPHTPTLQTGIFASKWPLGDTVLWTIVNRNTANNTGNQISVPYLEDQSYFDIYHGVPLTPQVNGNSATLSFEIEAEGYGAVLSIPTSSVTADLKQFLATMNEMTQNALAYYSSDPIYLQQTQVPIEPTAKSATAPPGMIQIPGNSSWLFNVEGVEIEGCVMYSKNYPGSDIQYMILNETLAQCSHSGKISIDTFYIDQFPVTNSDFKKFLVSSNYKPADPHNFLLDWVDGNYPSGWDNKPVTWVSVNDARAYAKWAGKRLPNEWEWQYAMQGDDGRLYPWGDTWDPSVVPVPDKGRNLTSPDDVDAHPGGKSPFGVWDGVGNVWQMTNEYYDEHTAALVLRGGSYYQPQGSIWYFPQAYQLDQHGKFLLMTDSYDRSGTLGFRCAVDST